MEEEKQDFQQAEAPGSEEQGLPEKKRGRELFDWVQALAISVLCVVLVFTFLARITGVRGSSMVQTLQHGDRLLVLSDLFCDYRQGDIVIAYKDSFYPEPIVKRVIAVAGQTVDIDFEAGVVYVDGVPLEEDYVNTPTNRSEGTAFPLTLKEGEVFLMGDNRNGSSDSRNALLGAVDTDYLMGKAVFLLFPGEDESTGRRDFSRIGVLH